MRNNWLTFKNKNAETEYKPSPFLNGEQFCPVCKETNRRECSITENGTLAMCKYVPSDQVGIDDRYVHTFEKTQVANKPIVKNETPMAEPDTIHSVYLALLQSLSLSPNHLSDLGENRGHSEQGILDGWYRTVPRMEERFSIAEGLSEKYDLTGVPGFYYDKKSDRWCLNCTFDGYYIPLRNESRQFHSLKIRRDDPTNGKYMLVSSKKQGGTTPSSQLHFVSPRTVRETDHVYVTEGELKANIAADLVVFKSRGHDEMGILSIGGVIGTRPEDLCVKLKEVFPTLKRITLAFDMDWKQKEDVKSALMKLGRILNKSFETVDIAIWDSETGNGIDDFLSSQPEQVDAPTELFDYVPFDDFEREESKEVIDEHQTAVEEKQTESRLLRDLSEDNVDTFAMNWETFQRLNLPEPESVIYGLKRGNIGLLVAPPDVGKSTLILNVALSAASGRNFYPLITDETVGKRIVYIDGESTRAELQVDIDKMLNKFSESERKAVEKNLVIICDEDVNDEPFDLVDESHLDMVLEETKSFNPDLIIVDTLSALATMEDENDNALVKKQVIAPLKKLAKQTDSAVLILHHTGKYHEGGAPKGAYVGRGASAFGALARMVINLRVEKKKTFLECSKIKGKPFKTTELKLDNETRWFTASESEHAETQKLTGYDHIVNFVSSKSGKVRKKDILEAFDGKNGNPKLGTTSIGNHLRDGVKDGDLVNAGFGYYAAPDKPKINVEKPLTVAK